MWTSHEGFKSEVDEWYADKKSNSTTGKKVCGGGVEGGVGRSSTKDELKGMMGNSHWRAHTPTRANKPVRIPKHISISMQLGSLQL